MLFAFWTSVKNEAAWSLARLDLDADQRGSDSARACPCSASTPNVRRVTYVVLGSNSENGHAAFIARSSISPADGSSSIPSTGREQFDETLACVEREEPRFVLVTLGFFETGADGSPWAEFVSRSRRLLQERYELVEEEHPGFQVWRRT